MSPQKTIWGNILINLNECTQQKYDRYVNALKIKDANRKIRKTELIYTCGSLIGSSKKAVRVSTKVLWAPGLRVGTKIIPQYSIENVVLIFPLASLLLNNNSSFLGLLHDWNKLHN